ncbi:hypothetical protein A3Q56_01564 [Intoshia linei]|uniref:Uncharacterized protein n=1 Tax=Intoshia linei TaxID=1819745 RepID=A0A177B8T8_9BILA|nr:hypothetical protein A3Q56_01564 [Intoshia linei]
MEENMQHTNLNYTESELLTKIELLESKNRLLLDKIENIEREKASMKNQIDYMTKTNENILKEATSFNKILREEREKKIVTIEKLISVMSNVNPNKKNVTEKLTKFQLEIQNLNKNHNREKYMFNQELSYMEEEVSKLISRLINEQDAHSETQQKFENLKKKLCIFKNTNPNIARSSIFEI